MKGKKREQIKKHMKNEMMSEREAFRENWDKNQ